MSDLYEIRVGTQTFDGHFAVDLSPLVEDADELRDFTLAQVHASRVALAGTLARLATELARPFQPSPFSPGEELTCLACRSAGYSICGVTTDGLVDPTADLVNTSMWVQVIAAEDDERRLVKAVRAALGAVGKANARSFSAAKEAAWREGGS